MLINYKDLVQKHGWKPKGVIHVGGHRGEEQEVYDALGVKKTIWFEAISESAKEIKLKYKGRNDILVINNLLSDKREYVNFNVSNNGASSSILELGTHKTNHPKIHYIDKRWIEAFRLDEVMEYSDTLPLLSSVGFDTLNIDVQGAELKVLKGAGDLLHQIKWIYCEVNIEEVYKGCALMDEIDDYLKEYGFERVETKLTPKGWGDAFYMKK
jgi:FkbM family methyltransferase